jgi:ketosteroid isomerase-like protein
MSEATFADRVLRGFRWFSEGETEHLVELIHPDCQWEEPQATGWPGFDPVYHGVDGARRWTESVREMFQDIEAIVERVDEFDYGVVVTTRMRARGRQGLEAEWFGIYNAIWFRDDLVIRRRAYFDYAEAAAAVGTDERMIEVSA